MMLAYVFWHWPQPDVDRETYEAHTATFHQTLAANGPPGFQKSFVFRINGANWLATAGPAYEDWYLLDDSAALDKLNEAAVTSACEQPHNRVAREAADGTGGLYRLRAGEEALSEARFAVWLAKPDGTSYQTFYDALAQITSQPKVGLWSRQMTLGPTTEFCLHSATQIQLPPGYTGREIALQRIL